MSRAGVIHVEEVTSNRCPRCRVPSIAAIYRVAIDLYVYPSGLFRNVLTPQPFSLFDVFSWNFLTNVGLAARWLPRSLYIGKIPWLSPR